MVCGGKCDWYGVRVNVGCESSIIVAAGRASLSVAFGAALACAAGCAEMRPVGTLEVKGHVNSLATSGSALIGDFLGNKTYIWDWGNLLAAIPGLRPRAGFDGRVAGAAIRVRRGAGGGRRPQPRVISQDRRTHRTVRQWTFDANWYCSRFVSNFSGRYMGVLLEENSPTGGDTCIGLVTPSATTIAWVPVKGRTVNLAEDPMAVSSDGRYVAILGLGDMQAVVVADPPGRSIAWRRAVRAAGPWRSVRTARCCTWLVTTAFLR